MAGCAGLELVQLRHKTELSSEEYIATQAWRLARLARCPIHGGKECGFRHAGYYGRKFPDGLRIALFHCPTAHCSWSLLPDFAAARVCSDLAEIESVVEAFESEVLDGSTHEEAAADLAPCRDYGAAIRWVNRRRRWVQAALRTVVGLVPALVGCEPSLAAVRAALGVPVVMVALRQHGAEYLAQIPAPLGFGPLPRPREMALERPPKKAGPDPPRRSL